MTKLKLSDKHRQFFGGIEFVCVSKAGRVEGVLYPQDPDMQSIKSLPQSVVADLMSLKLSEFVS